MTTESQLCNLAGCVIDGIKEAGEELSILAHCERAVANCPTCGKKSTRIHSYYIRRPRDLPIADRRVRLKLRVRRYRCLNSACPKQTFAERIPELLPVYAQRTTRLTKTLYRIGQALGGQAGSRLLGALHLSASPDTMLRILRQTFKPVDTIPKVLGVDDWAMRKGTTYGTILVDLERRQPVDLLPDRQASTLAAWLNVHPGVKVIVRDRSREYMRGATAGAPTAVQVADRWHLLKNLRQMLERLLHQLHRTLSQLPIKQFSIDVQRRSEPFGRSSTERAQSQESKKRRLSQFAEVQRLRRSGSNISQIARQLRLARGTVRRYFYAESFPERTRHPIAPSILDPYLPYLRKRIDDGCTNAQALWREIRRQGFRGSRDPVARWVQQQRQQPAPTTPNKYLATLRLASSIDEKAKSDGEKHPDNSQKTANRPRLPSASRLAWLLSRPKESLNIVERQVIHRICQHPHVELSHRLAQQFITMLAQRLPSSLDRWLADCIATGIACWQTFANGLKREYSAIYAAFTLPWSNEHIA